MKPAFEQVGLRSFYIGDEAILETSSFSLEGRAIRKVPQSVTRLEREGYSAELRTASELDEATSAALISVSEAWRGDKAERGFSMALGSICQEEHADTVMLIARDEDGRIRGFLHFVPSYGRAAMSLSSMRRDPDTPNGLTEFMVVKAVEFLREREVEEISLNFAAFARFLHSPQGFWQRMFGRGLSRADAVFQIERLYRFNAKFFPRWEPRYLMYEGSRHLPRRAVHAHRRVAAAGEYAGRCPVVGDARRTVARGHRPRAENLHRPRVEYLDRVLPLVVDVEPALPVAGRALRRIVLELGAGADVAGVRIDRERRAIVIPQGIDGRRSHHRIFPGGDVSYGVLIVIGAGVEVLVMAVPAMASIPAIPAAMAQSANATLRPRILPERPGVLMRAGGRSNGVRRARKPRQCSHAGR